MYDNNKQKNIQLIHLVLCQLDVGGWQKEKGTRLKKWHEIKSSKMKRQAGPQNRENMQIFPFTGFMWLFYQYLCNIGFFCHCLLLLLFYFCVCVCLIDFCFKLEILRVVQPCCFAFYQKEQKQVGSGHTWQPCS